MKMTIPDLKWKNIILNGYKYIVKKGLREEKKGYILPHTYTTTETYRNLTAPNYYRFSSAINRELQNLYFLSEENLKSLANEEILDDRNYLSQEIKRLTNKEPRLMSKDELVENIFYVRASEVLYYIGIAILAKDLRYDELHESLTPYEMMYTGTVNRKPAKFDVNLHLPEGLEVYKRELRKSLVYLGSMCGSRYSPEEIINTEIIRLYRHDFMRGYFENLRGNPRGIVKEISRTHKVLSY